MSSVKTANNRVRRPDPLIEILSRHSGNPDHQWGPETELFLLDRATAQPISQEQHVRFVMAVKELLKEASYVDFELSAEPAAHMLEFKMNPMKLTDARAAFLAHRHFYYQIAEIAEQQGIAVLPLGALDFIDPEILLNNRAPILPDDPEWGVRPNKVLDGFGKQMIKSALSYPVQRSCAQMNVRHNGPDDELLQARRGSIRMPFSAVFCEGALPFIAATGKANYNHLGLWGRDQLRDKDTDIHRGLLNPIVFDAKDGDDFIRRLAERAFYNTPIFMHFDETGKNYHVVDDDAPVKRFDQLDPSLRGMKNLCNAFNLWWHSQKFPIHKSPVRDFKETVGWAGVFNRAAQSLTDALGLKKPMIDTTHLEFRDMDAGPGKTIDAFILHALPTLIPECAEAVDRVFADAGYDLSDPKGLQAIIQKDLEFLINDRHDFIVGGGRIADIPMGNSTYGEIGNALYDALEPHVRVVLGDEYLRGFKRKCEGQTDQQWLIDNCHNLESGLKAMMSIIPGAFLQADASFYGLAQAGLIEVPTVNNNTIQWPCEVSRPDEGLAHG